MLQALRQFTSLESSSGILLILATLAALLLANSPLSGLYQEILAQPVGVSFGYTHMLEPVKLWINDGLMSLFFLLVSMEIKRELTRGQLASPRQAALPCLAALGGVVVPALIFWAFNRHEAGALRGWAIPTATDIAFSLGVLSLLGRRVPVSLKVFLAALAIADDLVAILIIALVYSDTLAPRPMALVLVASAGLMLLNAFRRRSLALYLSVGAVLWAGMLHSGIHATLAGVILGMLIPANGKNSPLAYLEKRLHPWVAYGIVPLFALANAGLSFEGLSMADVASPIGAGVALGLLLGKPIGILGASALCIKTGLAAMPAGANWLRLLATGLIAGIGFTMSFFVSGLAYAQHALITQAHLGIFVGSFCAALLGYLLFRIIPAANR